MAKIHRTFDAEHNRYDFDFDRCHFKKGWAQLDTRQDASYYGNWINPLTLQLMSYAEGDVAFTVCESEADFVATVNECVQWHRDNGYFKGVDGMCSEPIIAAFTRMGLTAILYPSDRGEAAD